MHRYSLLFAVVLSFVSVSACTTPPSSAPAVTSGNAQIIDLTEAGQYSEALAFGEKTLATAKEALGDRHPDTLQTYALMARLYEETGKAEAAEEFYSYTLKMGRRVFGATSPQTISNLIAVGTFYAKQGDAPNAEQHLMEATETTKDLEAGNPLKRQAKVALAKFYLGQTRFKEAASVFTTILDTDERLPEGTVAPQDRLEVLDALGGIYEYLERYESAATMHKKALVLRDKTFGVNTLPTLTSVDNLARSYAKLGRFFQAEALLRQTLTNKEKLIGKSHPSTIASLNDLAMLHSVQNRFEIAENLFKEALTKSRTFKGQQGATLTIEILQNMKELYKGWHKPEQEQAIERQLRGLQ